MMFMFVKLFISVFVVCDDGIFICGYFIELFKGSFFFVLIFMLDFFGCIVIYVVKVWVIDDVCCYEIECV